MLAGIIAKVNNGFVEFISYFTLSRWGVEGFSIIQNKVIKDVINEYGFFIKDKVDALKSIINNFDESYYNEETFGDLTWTIELDIIFIGSMIIITNFLIYYVLKSKDPIKGIR